MAQTSLHISPPKKIFCGFPGYKPVLGFGLRFVCWFYDGNIQRLTQIGFMEKLGIDPATPGLQDIGLSPTPRQLLPTYAMGECSKHSKSSILEIQIFKLVICQQNINNYKLK